MEVKVPRRPRRPRLPRSDQCCGFQSSASVCFGGVQHAARSGATRPLARSSSPLQRNHQMINRISKLKYNRAPRPLNKGMFHHHELSLTGGTPRLRAWLRICRCNDATPSPIILGFFVLSFLLLPLRQRDGL